MGQEIDTTDFTEQDFSHFQSQLENETKHLSNLLSGEQLSATDHVGGFELEVWIVDRDFNPIPINDSYLKRLNSELASPELSRFNIELNGAPENLQGAALSNLEQALANSWDHCYEVAGDFDASLVMIGTLPSVTESQLVLENMSKMKRYYALNEQVFKQRQGKPLKLDINGREHLMTTHYDVMLESATTSFQLHWQMPIDQAVRAYNASVIASAATVAVSANSPYLFGKDLWDETRIPLFEQSVQVGGIAGAAFGPVRRVGFGSGYARKTMLEVFNENVEHYPVLLPIRFDGENDRMDHLRLHNGTIWRWNRPLVGFDNHGTAHIRIEHRVISAGPTIVDEIANAAFYYGLARYLTDLEEAPEDQLQFATARDNFYICAKHGLQGHVTWFQDQKGTMQHLLQEKLIAAAREGLEKFDLDHGDIQRYIGIIEERVNNGQHGAQWQRDYMAKHQCSMQELTAAYADHQQSGEPVHSWNI